MLNLRENDIGNCLQRNKRKIRIDEIVYEIVEHTFRLRETEQFIAV